MRQCGLADEFDRVRAVPRQFRQLPYQRLEGRAKLVLGRARDGRICELALGRRAKFRNDLCKSGHAHPATGIRQ